MGNFPEDDFGRQEVGELDADLESDGLHREASQAGENFRSLLNTNTSGNSEFTAETSKPIISELSRQLEEVRMDLNAHVLEAIISAIEEKVLATIQNALEANCDNLSAKLDPQSDGLHLGKIAQAAQKYDNRSDGQHLSNIG